MPRRAALALAALTVLPTLVVSACSGERVATPGEGGGAAAGGNAIEQIPVGSRTTTIRLQGRTADGTPVDTADYRGKVVVLNTWGTWCGPCNAEAPALQQAWTTLRPQGVQFVGVNIRDDVASMRSFERKFKITYPSVRYDGGAVSVQLQGKAVNTPTTIVLDREGRVAARALIQVDAKTLTGLVQDVGGEPA